MPIYTYQCSSCSSRFELRQGWDAAATAECPTCRNEARRVLLAPSVIFKGRGWYSTDSRRASHHGLVGNGDGTSGGDGDKAAGGATAEEPKAAAAAD